MKNKIGISIILTLLIIASSFTAVEADENNDCPGEPTGVPVEVIEVNKQIFNGSGYVDEYIAEVGETVTYKINITYHKNNGTKLTDIVVIDNLDPTGNITYFINSSSFNYEPSDPGLPILWNLTDDYGVELSDGQSVVIRFNVTIISGYGSLINCVTVTALETCCHESHENSDCATIIVKEPPCEPFIDVDKKVFNGTGWADEIDGLKLGDIATFKIIINYTDCEPGNTIVCLEVKDVLPCCLEYANNVDYSESTFILPEIVPEVDGKDIFWNWTGTDTIQMNDGDKLVIIFDAIFVNYCEVEDYNTVAVHAWTCCDDFFGRDSVLVDCTPPETTFDKKVYSGNDLVDKINTTVGEILRFKLAITYYGNEVFNDLKFVDILPCILEYKDNARVTMRKDDSVIASIPIEGDLQEDNKTVWFNLTGLEFIDFELSDGVEISVEFDALVVGQTECGCDCEIDALNYGAVYVYICTDEQEVLFLEDELEISAGGNCPPSTPGVSGPTEGEVDENLLFNAVTEDPDLDQVYYMISIGTGTSPIEGDWIGPYNSGVAIPINHIFTTAGTYYINAKAKDEHGLESDWTYYPHKIVITEIPEPEVDLKITVSKFGLGQIKATVKNEGEDDVTNVQYTIKATGGILKMINIDNTGNIPEILTGQSKEISAGAKSGLNVIRGIGKISGSVDVKLGSYQTEKTFSGIIIGRIIILTQIS